MIILIPLHYYSLRPPTKIGEYSEPSPRFNTAPGPPEKPPMNVRGGGGITGDLTIEWDPLPRQDQNGPGVYYRIYYRRIGVDEERDFQQQTLKQLGTISRGFYVVKIQKKYYWTQYEVKVQVFNDLCLDHNCTVAPVSNTTSCAKNVTSLGKFYLQISKFLKRFYCRCLWNAELLIKSFYLNDLIKGPAFNK